MYRNRIKYNQWRMKMCTIFISLLAFFVALINIVQAPIDKMVAIKTAAMSRNLHLLE